jgi:hypothetical protein
MPNGGVSFRRRDVILRRISPHPSTSPDAKDRKAAQGFDSPLE